MTLLSILAGLLLAALASASPLTPPTPYLPAIHRNTTTASFSSGPQCHDSPDWTTSSFLGGDCYTAIDKFTNFESHKWGPAYLEFVSRDIILAHPSIWAQRTPRKYRYKSCTLAIVMLRDLPPGIVPGGEYPHSDLGNYVQLEKAARRILAKCISVVLSKGEGRGGGRLGFANPTGFDIEGQCILMTLFLIRFTPLLEEVAPHLH